MENNYFLFNIDSPISNTLYDRKVEIRGWVISKAKDEIKGIRITNGDNTFYTELNELRRDIALAYPQLLKDEAQNSGFEIEIEYSRGDIVIEVETNKGFLDLTTLNVKFLGGALKNYNPFMSTNWAEHHDIIDTKNFYAHEDATRPVVRSENDSKIISFYLPQYHPIPENDKTWGEGFTEWRNVTTAKPRFTGHRQPILPSDLGFYDLRLESNIEKQIKLAKEAGIFGFCIYYYWFSGKQILETPLNFILKHKEWDFNFMLCWANENWTKRWDGADKEVIIAQEYKDSDPLDFIKDVEHILNDPRYINIDGKPILAVYRPEDLNNASKYASVWRKYFRDNFNKELHLVSVLSFSGEDPTQYGFDGGIEFSPASLIRGSITSHEEQVSVSNNLLDVNFRGTVFDYRKIIKNAIQENHSYDFPVYRCLMPSWDNDARKKGKDPYVFYNESPDLFGAWLTHTLKDNNSGDFTFINAWNEWAEGTVLEPSIHYGHAYLNKVKESILSTRDDNSSEPNEKTAIIVQVKSYEQWAELRGVVKKLNSTINSDVFVILSDENSIDLEKISNSDFVHNLLVVPERGFGVLSLNHSLKQIVKNKYSSVLRIAGYQNDIESNIKSIKRIIVKGIAKKVHQKSSQLITAGSAGSTLDDEIATFAGELYGKETKDGLNFSQEFTPELFTFWASIDVAQAILNIFVLPEDFSPNPKIKSPQRYIEHILYGCMFETADDVYQLTKLGVDKIKTKR